MVSNHPTCAVFIHNRTLTTYKLKRHILFNIALVFDASAFAGLWRKLTKIAMAGMTGNSNGKCSSVWNGRDYTTKAL